MSVDFSLILVLLTALSGVDASVVSAEFIRPDLERVFLDITGSRLADDDAEDEATV